MVLARKNAIGHWRDVIGPTQTAKARDEAPGWYSLFYTVCVCVLVLMLVLVLVLVCVCDFVCVIVCV